MRYALSSPQNTNTTHMRPMICFRAHIQVLSYPQTRSARRTLALLIPQLASSFHKLREQKAELKTYLLHVKSITTIATVTNNVTAIQNSDKNNKLIVHDIPSE
jgi:hypothetical protein